MLLFLYSALGYIPCFFVKQNFIRKEIKLQKKNSVPEKELASFVFTKTEFANLKWEKENKEFHYGNSMYDIVKTATDKKGNIILHCINDKQEKQLFTNLEDLVRKNSSDDKTLTKFFKLLSNTKFSEKIIFDFVEEKTKKSFTEIHSSLISFEEKILSPPPELI